MEIYLKEKTSVFTRSISEEKKWNETLNVCLK